MKATLSTFMTIAITAICIGLLLFGTGYSLLENESGEYEQIMDDNRAITP